MPFESIIKVPWGLSVYAVTITPASAQQCKNHSMWHEDTEYNNMSSGLYKVASPRNSGAEEPARGDFPSADNVWFREYSV